MQIHYRPRGDDTVAQPKPFIFIVLPGLERERALLRLVFFFHFERQKFLTESSYMSSGGIPKCT